MGYHNVFLFITLFLGASYSRLVCASSVVVLLPEDKQRASFILPCDSHGYLITTRVLSVSLLLPDRGITTQNLNTLLVSLVH